LNILISGGIAVGKSTTAEALSTAVGARVVRVRLALAEILDLDGQDRDALQKQGAALDRRTQGRWLLHYLEERKAPGEIVIVDALRTRRQTLPVLDVLPNTHLVHLVASESVRRHRYDLAAASDRLKASVPFDVATAHETERAADEVRDLAELVLLTDELSVDETVELIVQRFGLTEVTVH
jgi:adenosyl cobinamide kinase/adenosyl cobinamide phosphate guanylyltransferase